MIHTLSPYSIRCHDHHLDGAVKDRYAVLDDVRKQDLFYIILNFLNDKSQKFDNIESDKQVYKFSSICADKSSRTIYCWMEVGSYGTASDIIDINSQATVHEKKPDESDINKHYIYFHLPLGTNEGCCFFHSLGAYGIKSLFSREFSVVFREQTGLNIQFNPLPYAKAFNDWKNATVRKIEVTKFKGLSDKADLLKKLGHHEQTISFKPKFHTSGFGAFYNYFKDGSEEKEVIEVLSNLGSQIKTTVTLGKKKRVFRMGDNIQNEICQIEVDKNVIDDVEGIPDYKKMTEWVSGISEEYNQSLYPHKRKKDEFKN